jgi:hypothetical protein
MQHLIGEAEDFTFETSGERFKVSRGERALTPFGGLVAFSAFLSKLGIIEKMVQTCPIKRTSNNATPVRDVLIGFILTCIQEGKRFRHIRSIQDDPTIAKVFNIERRIPGVDAVLRFFSSIDDASGEAWIHEAMSIIYSSLPTDYILDWDSTVTTRYGDQDGVEVGYNPRKPGRGSHHPLLCSVGGLRLCLEVDVRPGNVYSSSGWIEVMERLFRNLHSDNKPFINRADIGFCGEEFLSWHEESGKKRPYYLLKLKKTAKVKEAIRQVKDEQWLGEATFGVLQVAECQLQLHGWNKKRRVIVGRRLIKKISAEESNTLFGVCQYEYSAYVTNLSCQQVDTWQIADLYNQRCDAENVIDELKNQWGLSGFCSDKENVTAFAARMVVLSYNLWSLFVRFFSGTKHEEAISSRKEFLLIASSLVRSSRENALKMSVSDRLWSRLQEGYQRLMLWLESTASQLRPGTLFGNWGIAVFNNLETSDLKLLPVNCDI